MHFRHFLLTVEGEERTFLRELQCDGDLASEFECGAEQDRGAVAALSADAAAFNQPTFTIASPNVYAIESQNFPLTFVSRVWREQSRKFAFTGVGRVARL